MIKRLCIVGLAGWFFFHKCKGANLEEMLLQEYVEDEASVSSAHSSDTDIDIEAFSQTEQESFELEVFSSEGEEDDDTSKLLDEFGTAMPSHHLFEIRENISYHPGFLNTCSKALYALRRKRPIPDYIIKSPFIENLVRASYKTRAKGKSPFHAGVVTLIPLWIEALGRKNWKALIQMVRIWPDIASQKYNGDPFYKLLAQKNPSLELLTKLDRLRREQSYKAHSQLDKSEHPPFTYLPAQTSFAVVDYFIKRTETYSGMDDARLYSRLLAAGCDRTTIFDYLQAADGFSYELVAKQLIEEGRYHGFLPLFQKIPFLSEQQKVLLAGLSYLLEKDSEQQVIVLFLKAFFNAQKSTPPAALLKELERERERLYPSHEGLRHFLKDAHHEALSPRLKQLH